MKHVIMYNANTHQKAYVGFADVDEDTAASALVEGTTDIENDSTYPVHPSFHLPPSSLPYQSPGNIYNLYIIYNT